MRAIVISRYGDESVLEVVEQPVPEPQDGEVLLEVRAAGINPVDWKAREGALASVTSRPFPLGLGWDIAGVVAATTAPDQPSVGQDVYGMLPLPHGGAYQQFTTVPASAVAPMPAKLSFEQAAGVPLAALTAWQALDAADVRAGQRVLVQGGAGGVGHFAVQLARVRGAHVLATSSSHNLDFMRELGVHEPLDYTAGDQQHVEPVDVVIDAVGGQVQLDSWALLRPGGTLIELPGPIDEEHRAAGMRGDRVVVIPNAQQLAELSALLDTGELRVHIQDILPLERAAEAQRLSRAGRVRGKLVLAVT